MDVICMLYWRRVGCWYRVGLIFTRLETNLVLEHTGLRFLKNWSETHRVTLTTKFLFSKTQSYFK